MICFTEIQAIRKGHLLHLWVQCFILSCILSLDSEEAVVVAGAGNVAIGAIASRSSGSSAGNVSGIGGLWLSIGNPSAIISASELVDDVFNGVDLLA